MPPVVLLDSDSLPCAILQRRLAPDVRDSTATPTPETAASRNL
jgi:hypothetical protein